MKQQNKTPKVGDRLSLSAYSDWVIIRKADDQFAYYWDKKFKTQRIRVADMILTCVLDWGECNWKIK